MSIFVAIGLYLVVGVVLALVFRDSEVDAEFDTLTNVIGYIFTILTWPISLLWPLIKGVGIGLSYLANPKRKDRIMQIINEWSAEDEAQDKSEP